MQLTATGCAQVESTMKMQALQPQVKSLQDSYKGKDQQEMQARLLLHTRLQSSNGTMPACACIHATASGCWGQCPPVTQGLCKRGADGAFM